MDDMQNPGSMPEQQPAMTPPVPEPTPMPQEAPMPQSAPEPQSAPSASTSDTPHPTPASGERRGVAAISYLGIFCLIPLIFARDSAFAQYHAKQGLVIAGAGVVLRVLSSILWDIPFGGAFVSIIAIAIFIVSVMGIVKALSGEKFDLPYISEWAAKIHF